jgi:AraC-like DNA-binding protein
VGDSIENFGPGDLVLVGSHTPHCWLSDRVLGQSVRAFVVQFPEALFGSDFLNGPLGRPLSALFERARQGLSFTGPVRERVVAKLKTLFASSHNALDRTGMLLQILSELTTPEDQVTLALGSHSALPKSRTPAVLDLVIAHIDEHLDREMTQREVARLAGLSTAGFSRFFSRHFGKTFVTYVAELRTKRACQLLLGNEYSIAEVARLSGFHNLANFNRRFFRFKGMTPSEYRRLARSQDRLS